MKAVQIEVQLVSHRYFPARKMIQVSGTGSDETTTIPKVAPQETKSYEFPKWWIEEPIPYIRNGMVIHYIQMNKPRGRAGETMYVPRCRCRWETQ